MVAAVVDSLVSKKIMYQGRTMDLISQEKIEEIKNKLVAAYNPLAIYIFGAYAWGTPDEDHFLELMVIVKESATLKLHKRPLKGLEALSNVGGVPKDLVVLTKDEFDKRSSNENTLAYKVKHDGTCIYTRS